MICPVENPALAGSFWRPSLWVMPGLSCPPHFTIPFSFFFNAELTGFFCLLASSELCSCCCFGLSGTRWNCTSWMQPQAGGAGRVSGCQSGEQQGERTWTSSMPGVNSSNKVYWRKECVEQPVWLLSVCIFIMKLNTFPQPQACWDWGDPQVALFWAMKSRVVLQAWH